MPYSIPKLDGTFYTDPSLSVNTLKEALVAYALAGTLLSGCCLTGTDYIDISGVNLRNLKIPSSLLINCDFSNSDLTKSDLSDCYGNHDNDLIGIKCKFINSKLINSNLSYTSFTSINSDFNNCDMTNAKFSYSYFDCAYFDGAIFTNVIFDDTTISTIFFDLNRFVNCSMKNTSFYNRQLKKYFLFKTCDLSRANFSNCEAIVNSEISWWPSETGTNYENVFQGCNLTNVNFSDADLTGQVLTGNILTYCIFTDANLYQTILTNITSGSNCNFTRTNLQFSNLTNSNFSSSYLKECDFSDVILSGTNFSNCNLQKSSFDGMEYFKYVDFTNADLTEAIFLTSDISTFILKDSNLSKTVLSGCTFSSSNNGELDRAEYNLAVATEKLEADTITLQTISATIANPLQSEIDASIVEANSKTNYETGLSDLSDIIAQLKIDYTPPNAWDSDFNYYTDKEIDDHCKDLDTYASQNTSWDNLKTKKAFYFKPGPSEAEGSDFSSRDGYGANWYCLIYPSIFESYYILSLQVYNTVNGLKKIYEDAIITHDLTIKELQPLSGPYNIALETFNTDTLLVSEYQTEVNELSAAPTIVSYVDLDGANLTEANLTNANLTLCSLKGTIFSDTILTNVNFTSATLYDDDLSGTILKGCKFLYANLSGCNFSNIIDMEGLDFSYSDLRESNFTDSKFNGSIFDYANMTGSTIKAVDSFSGNSLSGFSTLTNVRFNGTILNDVALTKADFTGNTNLKGVSLTGSDLTGSRLDYCDMSESNLYGAVFNSVLANNAIFTSANMVRIDLSQSVLTNSVFTSANMQRAFLQSVTATYCDFQYALMFSDDMRYSDFTHSKFNYANMISCDLRNSSWQANNFSYADMSKVKANKADFLYPILTGTKLSFLETQKLNLLRAS